MALGRGGSARLGLRARELGLKIVIELEPFPLSLVNDVDTMVSFLDDVDLENVQANIDVSHLVLSHVQPEELRRLKGRAGHVHISDCDGQVHGDLPPDEASFRSVRTCAKSKTWRSTARFLSNWNSPPIRSRSSSGSRKPIRQPTSY